MTKDEEIAQLRAELAAIRAAGGEQVEVVAYMDVEPLMDAFQEDWRAAWNRPGVHRDALMTVAQHSRIVAAMAAELEHANQWRDLALQFDRHRMSAMALLKAVSAGNAAAADVDAFLAAPPPPPLAGKVSVPDGWRIERSGDRIIVQQLPSGAGYAAAREGESGIAESVLYLLADTLLAIPSMEAPNAD